MSMSSWSLSIEMHRCHHALHDQQQIHGPTDGVSTINHACLLRGCIDGHTLHDTHHVQTVACQLCSISSSPERFAHTSKDSPSLGTMEVFDWPASRLYFDAEGAQTPRRIGLKGSTASVGKLTPPSRRKPDPSMPWAKVYGTGSGTPSDLAAADASVSSVGLWSNLRTMHQTAQPSTAP